MTYEEAAAGVTTGGITALVGLRKGKIRGGTPERKQRVMVYGASGSVGTYAVQLGKHFGADVTGVCSTSNLDMVRSLGADMVIDYAREDLSKYGKSYDLVFDAVDKLPPSRGKHLLANKGVFVKVGTDDRGVSINDFDFLRGLVEQGKLKAIIDRTYPLEQLVEAHRYVGQGHKKGHVVVTVPHPPSP
jgi:NADPH:quinone reductase-like Zn-dependent oxidoreductase